MSDLWTQPSHRWGLLQAPRRGSMSGSVAPLDSCRCGASSTRNGHRCNTAANTRTGEICLSWNNGDWGGLCDCGTGSGCTAVTIGYGCAYWAGRKRGGTNGTARGGWKGTSGTESYCVIRVSRHRSDWKCSNISTCCTITYQIFGVVVAVIAAGPFKFWLRNSLFSHSHQKILNV